jgi:tetratricopeptide (TPR) repeat protein
LPILRSGFADSYQRYREARALLYRLLDRYEAILPDTSAAIQYALGFANIELANYTEAEIHLKSAWQIYRDLDLRINVLRTEVGAGRLMVRRGELQDAMVHLRTLKADLLSDNLVEEAGLCDLEIVDALLRDHRPEEAEAVARRVVQDFTDAGLNKRAVEAVGYLSEAVAAKKANTAMITEIGDYIVSLRTNPERELRLTGTMA